MCLLLVALVTFARAQFSFSDQNAANSVSGQFLVSLVPDHRPPVPNLIPKGDTNIIQLKTALLAVAAERFKMALWQQLGIRPDAAWSGKIFLRLHPARSLDETVAITSDRFLDHWNYIVDLPDTLTKTRYARALSGVLSARAVSRVRRAEGWPDG